jgi:DNA polymerase III delta subunit
MNPKPAAYLFHGNDEYPLTNAAQALVERLVPVSERAFGLEVIDGRAAAADDVMAVLRRCSDGLLTAGFLTGGKLVWLRQATFLADARLGANEGVKAAVTAFTAAVAQGLAAGQNLLVTAPGVDKRSALYRVFSAQHTVQEFSLSDKQWQAEKQAAECAAGLMDRCGLRADGQVIKALIERVGVDSRTLANEVEKLSLYCGDRRTASLEDVRTVASASAGAVTWDLLDAVGARAMGDAVASLRRLLTQREAAMSLVMALNRRVNDLALYREAYDRGWLTAEGSSGGVRWRGVPPPVEVLFAEHYDRDPRSANPYYAGKLCQQALNFSASELRRAQGVAVRACEALVSGGGAEATVAELMILRVLQRAPDERAPRERDRERDRG